MFIKSVLRAIPIYTMQCFLTQVSLCRDLKKIISRFWWRNSKSGKGIHWCEWDHLCLSKAQGGMGFRDLAKFNNSLISEARLEIDYAAELSTSKSFRF